MDCWVDIVWVWRSTGSNTGEVDWILLPVCPLTWIFLHLGRTLGPGLHPRSITTSGTRKVLRLIPPSPLWVTRAVTPISTKQVAGGCCYSKPGTFWRDIGTSGRGYGATAAGLQDYFPTVRWYGSSTHRCPAAWLPDGHGLGMVPSFVVKVFVLGLIQTVYMAAGASGRVPMRSITLHFLRSVLPYGTRPMTKTVLFSALEQSDSSILRVFPMSSRS